MVTSGLGQVFLELIPFQSPEKNAHGFSKAGYWKETHPQGSSLTSEPQA